MCVSKQQVDKNILTNNNYYHNRYNRLLYGYYYEHHPNINEIYSDNTQEIAMTLTEFTMTHTLIVPYLPLPAPCYRFIIKIDDNQNVNHMEIYKKLINSTNNTIVINIPFIIKNYDVFLMYALLNDCNNCNIIIFANHKNDPHSYSYNYSNMLLQQNQLTYEKESCNLYINTNREPKKIFLGFKQTYKNKNNTTKLASDIECFYNKSKQTKLNIQKNSTPMTINTKNTSSFEDDTNDIFKFTKVGDQDKIKIQQGNNKHNPQFTFTNSQGEIHTHETFNMFHSIMYYQPKSINEHSKNNLDSKQA